jgi:hypothetical protein
MQCHAMMQIASSHGGALFEILWWEKAMLLISRPAIAKLEFARLPRSGMMATRSGSKAKETRQPLALLPEGVPTEQKWQRMSVLFSSDCQVLQSVTIRDSTSRIPLMLLSSIRQTMVLSKS